MDLGELRLTPHAFVVARASVKIDGRNWRLVMIMLFASA